jgi:hypothetical protein
VIGRPSEISAEAFISEIQASGNLTQIHKRKAQVFLAAVPDHLCRGAGLGFKRGFFDKSHISLTPLKDFLQAFIALVPDIQP